jgi:anti-sigma B factor antagonist
MAELNSDSSPQIVIDTSVDPTGASIISVSGELDISTARALEVAVASIIDEHPQRLVFDLSGLRFMDSAGVAVLIGAAAKVTAIHLRNPSPIVRRVVEVTGLSGVLPIES